MTMMMDRTLPPRTPPRNTDSGNDEDNEDEREVDGEDEDEASVGRRVWVDVVREVEGERYSPTTAAVRYDEREIVGSGGGSVGSMDTGRRILGTDSYAVGEYSR